MEEFPHKCEMRRGSMDCAINQIVDLMHDNKRCELGALREIVIDGG